MKVRCASSSLWPCLAGTALLLAASSLTQAQEQRLTAKGALQVLSLRFGPEPLRALVEMRAQDGQSQPWEWEIISHNHLSPNQLRYYWVGGQEATDEGDCDDLYPLKPPAGFINYDKFLLDSNAAFTVAEGAARAARVGFDSVNYTLRARELSDEPLWILDLVDARDFLVGKVYVSGETGSILRTLWIDRKERFRGAPSVDDSAMSASIRQSTTETSPSPPVILNNSSSTAEPAPPAPPMVPNRPPQETAPQVPMPSSPAPGSAASSASSGDLPPVVIEPAVPDTTIPLPPPTEP